MSALDEVQSTAFQVRPYVDRTDEQWTYDSSKCVFCYYGFDMDNVRFIGDIEGGGSFNYKFPILIAIGRETKKLEPYFPTKASAIRGQREFWRAFTRTGEFKHEPKATSESDSEGLGQSDTALV